jgi:Lactate dehydrogenase and related dehydrogenases
MNHTITILDIGTMGSDISLPDFSSLGELAVYHNTRPDEVADRIKNSTVVLTNKVPLTAETIAAAPRLSMIGTIATGYNLVDIAATQKRGIPVCNVPNYSTASVAQHTFALILALASRVAELSEAVKAGEWARAEFFCFWKNPVIELEGKTLGVVGFGNIGQAVAALGHQFGMRVLACTPRPKPAPNYQPFAFASLDELFEQSDVLSLHCPLTSDTDGMVNAARLKSMKKNAFIINCSRGTLINIPDLVEALQNKVIGGAGLDVIPVEPMADNDILHTAPNCIITPHSAWASAEARTRLIELVYQNVKAFIEGKPQNVVNNVRL